MSCRGDYTAALLLALALEFLVISRIFLGKFLLGGFGFFNQLGVPAILFSNPLLVERPGLSGCQARRPFPPAGFWPQPARFHFFKLILFIIRLSLSLLVGFYDLFVTLHYLEIKSSLLSRSPKSFAPNKMARYEISPFSSMALTRLLKSSRCLSSS